MKLAITFCALAVAMATQSPAQAAPALDCPMRDAPFSVDLSLLDIMLSPQAKAAADKTLGGRLAKMPAQFGSTQPPTFAAILTLRNAAAFMGATASSLAELDARLRALPVTEADRIARCARYDNDTPTLDLAPGKPHLLLFEKINGFKDAPGFNAAHDALLAIAKRRGWDVMVTDRGGAFSPKILKHFSAVIWNNISGDVLTISQRAAFRSYIEKGGGFVGVHGSGGDPVYFWNWYADTLLGARFAGHPMNPQFQDARIVVDKANPVAADLPPEWVMKDEWYSFATNPRKAGANVVATLDEDSYRQAGYFGEKLTMGDHPIAWINHIGRGRMFYSAIGHLPQSYSDPRYVAMLENGIEWTMSHSGKGRHP